MSVIFPITIRAKDSGKIYHCESIAHIQYRFEEVDVENEEFEAWDANGVSIALLVQKPVWLNVRIKTDQDNEVRATPISSRSSFLKRLADHFFWSSIKHHPSTDGSAKRNDFVDNRALDPLYPLEVKLKDASGTEKCASVYEIQSRLTKREIKKGEIEAWDAEGRPVIMSVQKPLWLHLELLNTKSQTGQPNASNARPSPTK